ncbi:MAG: erythromycin esterase family protein [Acidobacteriota bacterium]
MNRRKALLLAAVLLGPPAAASGPPTATLQGRVGGADGKPVAGALVSAMPVPTGHDFRPAATAVSDTGGRFRLEVPPGSYTITATALDREGAYLAPRAATPGGTVSGLDLAMGSTPVHARGVVKDATGKPISGAYVCAIHYGLKDGDVYVARSAGDGTFDIGLAPSTYGVMSRTDDRASHELPVGAAGATDLVLTLAPLARGPVPAAAKAWLDARVHPIATVEAGHGFDDLEPVAKMVGDAHVVALGEATHGSRELFQIKHRLLEMLVARKGFTVFAIEASFPDALAIDGYVREGKGDPAEALAGLGFWTWDTEEVLDLVRWMRSYNEDPAHAKKLRFYGFDMQNPAASVKALAAYFAKDDPIALAASTKILEDFAGAHLDDYARLPGTTKKLVEEGIAAIGDRLARKRPEGGAALEEWKLARMHLTLVSQAEEMLRTEEGSVLVRDRAMADNVAWIREREGPDAKVLLWAHNGHVSREEDAMAGGSAMGAHLHRMYGVDFVSFGLLFHQGGFRARNAASQGDVEDFTIGPPCEESLEAALAATGRTALALDLRDEPADPAAAAWLSMRRPIRSIGAVYSKAAPDAYYLDVLPAEAFDGILYVGTVTPAHPNPSATILVRKVLPAPANMSFEVGGRTTGPTDWSLTDESKKAGFAIYLTTENPALGRQCIRIEHLEGDASAMGVLSQGIDAAPYRGKKVRLRASVRSELEGDASLAQIFLKVSRTTGAGFYDDMMDRPVHHQPEWKELEIQGDVAPDAAVIDFGMFMVGRGTAWLDAVSLEVVEPTPSEGPTGESPPHP